MVGVKWRFLPWQPRNDDLAVRHEREFGMRRVGFGDFIAGRPVGPSLYYIFPRMGSLDVYMCEKSSAYD